MKSTSPCGWMSQAIPALHLVGCITIIGGGSVAIAAPAHAQGLTTSSDDAGPEIEYSGGQWTHTLQLPMAYAGTLSLTNSPGATATFRFSGTTVGYVFRMGPSYGIVSILIDGVDHGAIDLYSPHDAWQVTKWLTVATGEHTLMIRSTGLKHRAAIGTHIVVDRFIVAPTAATRGLYDNGDPRIMFSGGWHDAAEPAAYGGSYRHASGTDGTAPSARFFSFTFAGDQVTYIGARGQNRGRVAVVIDGIRRSTIDLYTETTEWQVAATFDRIGSGIHELHVTVLGEKHPSSADYVADIDAVWVGLDPRCGSEPAVIYTFVPLLGTAGNLEGRLCNIDPTTHATVTYIRVGAGYWVKPYAASPVTFAHPDTAVFVTDVTTGGNDASAAEFVTYAIPAAYGPPILLGATTIPPSLETAAVAKVVVTRHVPPPPYRGPVLGPVINSSFTSGVDGWQNPSIRLSGVGDPPPSLEFQELYRPGDAFMLAPVRYLGSFAHFHDGAQISFQHRVELMFDPGFWGAAVGREVRLSGPGGSATWVGSAPVFSAHWTTVTVPLNATYWTQTSGTWHELLEQVTDVQIRVDHFNDLFGAERTQFDNIALSAGYSAVPPFTDDPLLAGETSIRSLHIGELRTRIDALRGRFGLQPFSWTNASLAGVLARAVHIMELRIALAQVYEEAGEVPPKYTEPTLGAGVVMKAAHVQELRVAVAAIE